MSNELKTACNKLLQVMKRASYKDAWFGRVVKYDKRGWYYTIDEDAGLVVLKPLKK